MKVIFNAETHFVNFEESTGQWIIVRVINGKLYGLKLGDETTTVAQLAKLLRIDDETWRILASG